MNTRQREAELFLQLTAYELNPDAAVRERIRAAVALTWDTADPAFLRKLAKFHDMASTVYLAVKDMKLPLDPEIRAAFEKDYQKALYKCTLHDALYEQLSALFEASGIRHLPLKGLVMRGIYPRREMRTSGDTDVFYEACNPAGGLAEQMAQCGFTLTKHSTVVDTYTHAGGAVFEMHRAIADDFEVHSPLRGDVWQAAVPAPGKQYEYRLTKEDFYVYHIAHLAKHFTGKGCGVRPVADVYVFWQTYRDAPDRVYMDAQLAELGLTTFERVIHALADVWFGGETAQDALISETAQNILWAGVYGNMQEMAVLDGVKKASGKGGGLARQSKSFFLPLERMKVKYPVLEKAPILLPVCWCLRGGSALVKKHTFYRKMAQSYKNADADTVAARASLLNRLGL